MNIKVAAFTVSEKSSNIVTAAAIFHRLSIWRYVCAVIDTITVDILESFLEMCNNWAVAWDFQQFDILTSVDSDEPETPNVVQSVA